MIPEAAGATPFGSSVEKLEQVLAPLFRQGSLSESEFLRIAARRHHIDPRDAELADDLVAGASEVLDSSTLKAIIRADISETAGAALVADTKKRFRRYLPLLPVLFQYLKLERPEDALGVIDRIDDCCHDAPLVAKRGRRDANRRKVLRDLLAARNHIAEAERAAERLRYLVGYEFDNIKDVHVGNAVPIGGWSPPAHHLEDLLQGMRFLRSALAIKRTLIEDGGEDGMIDDNQVKLRIVDCAYDLTRIAGGPAFVTTPGSDFSFVCSLIYEMATGKQDESMAGAISRFARSAARQEADEYDREYNSERDLTREQDNFASRKSSMEIYLVEARKYASLVNDERLDREARHSALLLVRRATERAEAASNEVGPFLLWVDQFSEAHREALAEEHRELNERQREVDIRLGELRRRGLKIGLHEWGG